MGVFLLNLTKKAFRIKVTPFPLLLFPDEDSIEWKRRNKFNNNIFSDYANLFLNFELDEILEQQHNLKFKIRISLKATKVVFEKANNT